MAGAPAVSDLEAMLFAAGFEAVSLAPKPESREYIKNWLPGSGCEDYVVSANVTARKPLRPVGASLHQQGGCCSSSSSSTSSSCGAAQAAMTTSVEDVEEITELDDPPAPPASSSSFSCGSGGGCGGQRS